MQGHQTRLESKQGRNGVPEPHLRPQGYNNQDNDNLLQPNDRQFDVLPKHVYRIYISKGKHTVERVARTKTKQEGKNKRL